MYWVQNSMTRISILLNDDRYKCHFENQGLGGLVIYGAVAGMPQGLEELQSLAAAVQAVIKVPLKGIRYDNLMPKWSPVGRFKEQNL
ncbi:MAG: hypothetical protein Q9223_002352 [Gallowayella weberi]